MASSRLLLTPAPDRRNHASREALLVRVRGEFTEMPCLRLTRGQAQRLFDLRPDICERVLATLVRDQTLICGTDGRYRSHGDSSVAGPSDDVPTRHGRPESILRIESPARLSAISYQLSALS